MVVQNLLRHKELPCAAQRGLYEGNIVWILLVIFTETQAIFCKTQVGHVHGVSVQVCVNIVLYSFARKRASETLPRRLSRQIIRILEAITMLAPVITVGSGHSFQIIQPNSVAHTILL
jgi:hypothetical protein